MKPLNKKILLAVFFALGASAAALFLYLGGTVTIIADGKKINARSRNVPVGELIKSYGISFSSSDIVSPPPGAPAPRHGNISVVRVTERTDNVTETLPFIMRWSKQYTKNLRPAELQKGTQRIRIKLVKTVFHDGKLASSETVRERTTVKTVYRLALLNEDGTWQCLYDLSKSIKIKMIATAYYPGDPLAWGDGKTTYLGEKMQRGIVAVDPRVIPLKTRVFVSDYGYGWAGDTGSVIKRKRIDLGVNNREEEKDYMHVPVTVYILEKAESW